MYEIRGLRLTVLGIKIAYRRKVYRASKKKGELSVFTLRFVLRDLIPENTAVEYLFSFIRSATSYIFLPQARLAGTATSMCFGLANFKLAINSI